MTEKEFKEKCYTSKLNGKVYSDLLKKTSLLMLVLIVFSCAGSKQTAGINDAEAPLDTKIIEIITDLSSKEAYKKIANHLQDSGFALGNTDATLMTITTQPKTPEGLPGRVKDFVISASIREGEKTKIVLQGTYEFLNSTSDIKKYGAKGSINRKTWTFLHNLATDFGGELNYRK